jgi:hypothetical protein
MCAKLKTQVLSTAIGSEMLDFPIKLILNFTLEFFELFKRFRLVFHQIDITVSTQVISEGDEVTITIACRNAHWSTYVCMYDPQQIRRPFNETFERCPGHFAHEAWFACIEGSEIQRVQESIGVESLHALYTNMTKTAMPQKHGGIVTTLNSFGFYVMDVSTTIEIQQE